MPSVNDKILDEIIGHSVDLQRLEASVKFRIRKELKKLEKGLVDELNNSNIWDARREQTRQKRLKALLKQTKETIKSAYKTISKEHLATLTGVASLAERQAVNAINKAINFELASVSMSKQMLKAIASDTLFEGAPSKEWWARRGEAFQARFADTIRQGMMRGDDTKTITRNLVGTAKNKFKDAALARNYRSAEALVRTSIQSVANEARLMTYADNDDIIKEIEWVSTLDSRTTQTCMALDGLKWKNPSREPVGHSTTFVGTTAHWGCRSTQVPITKSWEELGAKGDFNEIPESTRASMDGQVSSKLSYEGWLKGKSESFQREVLGAKKFDLWKKGELKFTDMVNQSGNALTVEQLNIKLDKPKKIKKVVKTDYDLTKNVINSASIKEATENLSEFTTGLLPSLSGYSAIQVDGMVQGFRDVLGKYKNKGKVTKIGKTNDAVAQYIPPDKWQPDDGFNIGDLKTGWSRSLKNSNNKELTLRMLNRSANKSGYTVERQLVSDLAKTEYEYSRMTFNHEAWHKIDMDNGLEDVFLKNLRSRGLRDEVAYDISWYAYKGGIDEMFAEVGALYSTGFKNLIPKQILEAFEETIKDGLL